MKKLLLLFLLFPTLSIAESYLCIAEAAGGVLYNQSTDKFNGTSFSTDSKYIVKKENNSKENNSWIINDFGGDFDLTLLEGCSDSRLNDRKQSWDFLSCKTTGGRMQIDITNLKFIKTYTIGYQGKALLEKGIYVDTPNIEVGSCSKI
jgi:hypothetical protein